jgi:hypothetical protein
MPPLSQHVRIALLNAQIAADEDRAPRSITGILLYGVLAVDDCNLTQVCVRTTWLKRKSDAGPLPSAPSREARRVLISRF